MAQEKIIFRESSFVISEGKKSYAAAKLKGEELFKLLSGKELN